MFKGKKLSELRKEKYLVVSSVLMLLVILFVLLMAAWANNTVNIYDGELVMNIKTKQSTVADVLADASITLGDFDSVEPGLDELIHNNMDIVISRAVLVTVTDAGVPVEYYSTAKNVAGVINQTGYTIGEFDRIVPALDAEVISGMNIEIKRAKRVFVINNNESKEVYSCAETVEDFLNENNIIVDENTMVNLKSDVAIKSDMKIKITPVEVSYEDITEAIPYKTETRNNSSMPSGSSKVIQSGSNGTRVITFEVKSKDGVEISRKQIDSKTTKDAVNRIVEVGTAANKTKSTASSSASSKSSNTSSVKTSSSGSTSNAGKNFNYSKVLTCRATAYDLSYESCGKRPGDKNYGITASGMKARYGVVAVDPSVIPLGTKLYIESLDGSWAYGYCVAGDTGGGICGNSVDLFFDSHSEAIKFGRRQVKVYILS